MTQADVFIIESLGFHEEDTKREGEVLARTLRMSGKNPRYHYVRTKAELDHFIEEFDDSGYRYLHISCHGNKLGLYTTIDPVPTAEFVQIASAALHKRRLFVSACEVATMDFAEKVFSEGDCYSIAGPRRSPRFDDSVIMWSAFYHLMFKHDRNKMTQRKIKQHLAACAALVGEEICFYARTPSGKLRRTLLPVRQTQSELATSA